MASDLSGESCREACLGMGLPLWKGRILGYMRLRALTDGDKILFDETEDWDCLSRGRVWYISLGWK